MERAHARLAEFIRATESELEESLEWSAKLKLASHCYNNTVHSTTGYSPYYLMFDRHPRLITAVGNDVDILRDTYLEKFDTNLKLIWAKAKVNIDNKKRLAIDREKREVKKRMVIDIKVGDKV